MTDSETTQKLSDLSYQEMIGLIRDGTWAANTRLPSEYEMASQLGVSRPVVRQALARLREDGLIMSRRGSGSFVTREPSAELQYPAIASIADLEPFASFREGVEGEAAALAAERRSDHQLGGLRAMSSCPHGISGEEGANHDFDFHVKVADASRNPFYANTLLSLRTQVTLFMTLTWKVAALSVGFSTKVNQQHQDIVDAIEARNPEQARAAMRYHIRWTHSRLMNGQSGEVE
ncbi:FadR/GntR family transcriptional regulator [Neorhizobium tomejilense]|uniref:FadR/GntR family transcriptional regulator n=1 Tax=Neorhizobium tomejilense TaxID=2093828 RepID=UPI003ECEE080